MNLKFKRILLIPIIVLIAIGAMIEMGISALIENISGRFGKDKK